jgi:protein-tyrosine phosphatase
MFVMSNSISHTTTVSETANLITPKDTPSLVKKLKKEETAQRNKNKNKNGAGSELVFSLPNENIIQSETDEMVAVRKLQSQDSRQHLNSENPSDLTKSAEKTDLSFEMIESDRPSHGSEDY